VPLRLVRIDDRLIHGQVVAVWLRAVGADRIVIVDDKTAQNEFLREVLTLAAPQGTPVEVYGLTEGVARVAELASSPMSVFLLMRTPLTALRLRELGVQFDMLNVGGLGAGPGRRPLYKNISATDEELAALRKLEEMGTKVELRIVADDRGVPFASVDQR
jgi:mannose/fructose/N-acetylgalactosamine-specific phosphotransferase system component IIB